MARPAAGVPLGGLAAQRPRRSSEGLPYARDLTRKANGSTEAAARLAARLKPRRRHRCWAPHARMPPCQCGARADGIFGNATVHSYQHEPVFI
jgi:hypothetical protein